MKLILLFWFFCASNLSYSQYTGSAEYSVLIGKDSLFQSQAVLKNIYDDAMDNSQKLTFLLEFNENESIFSLKQNIITDNMGFTLSMVGYENPIYTNTMTSEKMYTSDDNEYLITDSSAIDWKLSSETKMIDNYLCYKATTVHKVISHIRTFEFLVTAWYCPKIPAQFGPIGYGKLPGLILELQRRNFVYGLKNINLNNEKIEIKKPSKGRKISSQDYNAKLIEAYKRSKEDFERSKN